MSSVTRLAFDQGWRFQFLRYVTIGGIVLAVDVGSFKLLLGTKIALFFVTTTAYALAICTHFTLNKFINFRAHNRPVHHQAANYAWIALAGWIITVAVVEIGTHRFGLAPLLAKLAAVVINLPIGFLGHRFVTFGNGFFAALRRIGVK